MSLIGMKHRRVCASFTLAMTAHCRASLPLFLALAVWWASRLASAWDKIRYKYPSHNSKPYWVAASLFPSHCCTVWYARKEWYLAAAEVGGNVSSLNVPVRAWSCAPKGIRYLLLTQLGDLDPLVRTHTISNGWRLCGFSLFVVLRRLLPRLVVPVFSL